ncbi:MAG TPA: hypothetical protein VLH40_01810 [Atribacteraceae bacterium]|nr:hypothetical protein [Atribacteraceae bacterium]
MENALEKLLHSPTSEKEKRGTLYTPLEIARQTDLWPDTARRVAAVLPELKTLIGSLSQKPHPLILLSGAGTSEFIGYCLDGLYRRQLRIPTGVFPSPLIVTNPEDVFVPESTPLLISFARSGNSPESVGAYALANQFCPKIKHLVITCNRQGSLALQCGENIEALCLTLDDRTNDHGLAMTASFSNMVIAGQGVSRTFDFEEFPLLVGRLVSAGKNLLLSCPDILEEICRMEFDRAVFLGNGANRGTAVESHLKLQELTAGRVMCAWDTYLGLRHGPEAVIDKQTIVVAYLSSDPLTARYEQELMAELRVKRLGKTLIAVGASPGKEIQELADVVCTFDPDNSLGIPDAFSPPVQVIVGQLLGLFKSLALGLKPDAPSEQGTINRVVKGVKIYDSRAFREQGLWQVTAES